MNKYLRITRPDHSIKQLFIIPGFVAALFMLKAEFSLSFCINFLITFIATTFIASSNYVINEWLDREFDKFHPVKKHRSVVENHLNPHIVYLLYAVLAVIGEGGGSHCW